MVVWYVLFPLAVIGALRFRHRAEVMMIAVTGLLVLAMATAGIMVGTDPFRHRIMGMALFAILASPAIDKWTRRGYRWVIWLWTLGAISFTALWLALRL